MMKNYILVIFLSLSLLASCIEAQKTIRKNVTADLINSATEGDNKNGDGVTNQDDDVQTDDEVIIPKVEIRHLIEPKIDEDSTGGDYKRKLTIPKNYSGNLYVAGINISTLSSKSVKVRFNFGLNSLPIDIDATITTAPGLTPKSSIQVLNMDLRSKPFQDVQLLYDLFDYNEYDFDGTGTNDAALNEPVSSNRDDKLFCRGLKLEDDSTFTGNLVDRCTKSDDVCKYAYAKVIDKGLVVKSTNADPDQPIVPTEPEIQSGSLSFFDDTNAIKLNRCLPDNPINAFNVGYPYNTALSTNAYNFSLTVPFATLRSTQNIDSVDYIYMGPYRALNTSSWEITAEALKGKYGIFKGMYDEAPLNQVDVVEWDFGYKSNLYPLYTKFDLVAGTEYMGSINPDGQKIPTTMGTNGVSDWMDGCNERATTVHNITGESIGSCNVTATIEIIARDDETGLETRVDITNEVKLQLVKPILLNSNNENVLLSSFRQCSSSGQCGSDECCINKHCWSKTLANQCIEDLPSYGNQVTGELCTSDYQCSSLCCNKIDGRCAPHDTVSENPSYCSKPSGQSCVAKEWCQKHPVTTCAIIDTGTDNQGGKTCALRCVTAEVFGECQSSNGLVQGICVPPEQPDTPIFDPNDPKRCEKTLTFEELVECANNPDTKCELK